ncbi:hypothetical protein ACGFXC_35000 [Streptomyces sp. NPDC048507]|uniref:hypothetical protein n=1 Tax=Streptomyces sp. NPDC048507 TaxID=3365560 RepID=UPI0037238C1D
MRQKRPTTALLLPTLLSALVAVAAWAAWLGWDQHRDVHPDGSVTGPYEAWQVIGLVLTLVASAAWAGSRRQVGGTVLGTATGLTAAAYADWSDDSSGLFVIGVGLIATASLLGSWAVASLARSVTGDARGHGPH